MADVHESAVATGAVASLVVRPSTLAAITIWNGEATGGAHLVIDRIFSHQLVSHTAISYAGLWYCVHTGPTTKPANDIVTLRGSGDGGQPLSNTFVDVGATVVDDGWFPCGDSDNQVEVTSALPGSNLQWECNGRLIVPPLSALSVQVVSGHVANTYTSGVSWWRVQL